MPVRAGFPGSGVVLPRRFRRKREHRDVGVPATFFSASLPMKPMRVTLLRYINFSCSARLSRAPGSEWARLPRQGAAFLGGPERGSQNRNGASGKAEAPQTPGAAIAPKQCRDRGRNRDFERQQERRVWSSCHTPLRRAARPRVCPTRERVWNRRLRHSWQQLLLGEHSRGTPKEMSSDQTRCLSRSAHDRHSGVGMVR